MYILILVLLYHLPAPANDLEQLMEKGTITFGFSRSDLPPFFRENSSGEMEGLDVEIAEEIASLLSLKPVFDRSAQPMMSSTGN